MYKGTKIIITAIIVLLIACDSNNSRVEKVRSVLAKTEKSDSSSSAADSSLISENKRVEPNIDSTENSWPKATANEKKGEIKSILGLWNSYKLAKEKAEKAIEQNNLKEIISNLTIAGECAYDLSRPGIAAWQFNNIGHYSIDEFRKRTDCDNRLRTLATMEIDSVKTEYLNQTKILFQNNIKLLLQVEKHLERAQIIDDELPESRRTETIKSNVEFISWVKDFIKE